MASTQRIFEESYLDSDGYIIMFNNQELTIPERRTFSFQLPRPLEERRALSSEEFEAIDYAAGVPNKTCFIHPSHKEELIPVARHVSSEAIYEMGLLNPLINLREQLLSPGFLEKIRQCKEHGAAHGIRKNKTKTKNNDDDPKQEKMSFSIGLSAGRHDGPRGISLGNVGRARDREIDEWKLDLFRVAMEILGNCFPDDHAEARRKLWLKGSFTPIPPNSTDPGNPTSSYRLTSAWLNISDPTKPLECASTKPFTNAKDDPTEYTVMFCLSNLPENYFGGRISLTSQRISFSLRPLEALIFATRYYSRSG